MIDSFSKWAEAIVVPEKTRDAVISALFKNWIYRYGVPEVLVSDNDRAFCNAAFENVFLRTRVKKLTSSPYHSQDNAVIESFHKTINRGFRNFDNSERDVQDIIDLIMYSYRIIPHASNSQSQFFMVYGFDPSLAKERDWRFIPEASEKERFK